MATNSLTVEEKELERYRQIGFPNYKDYPYPDLNKEEIRQIINLIALVKLHFVDDLPIWARSTPDFYRFFGNWKREIESFIKKLKQESPNYNLPEQELIDKLNQRYQFEAAKNFYQANSGETRSGPVYENDGETIKKGWVRLYYK